MLDRVLEPEVMDTPWEAADYDAMDHAAVNWAFVSDFIRFAPKLRGPVLDVGTGTALIPIELARWVPGLSIVAVDAAAAMIRLAAFNVKVAEMFDRIATRVVNARNLPFADGEFPAVISNSIVHHIAEPEVVVAEMVRVCRPGGAIFVRDLARPVDLPTLESQVETYAGGANPQQRKMFAESLHAALTVEEVRGLVAVHGFAAASVAMTSDRHWTWAAVKA